VGAVSAPATTSAIAGPAREAWWRATWLPAAAVGALTLAGLAIRIANFDQGLLADELSTYWIIHDRGLHDVLDLVHSDAEITPPLYFALSWLTLKVGSAPEWSRLPSLLAGTASIPLVYLLGARTVGRPAGVLAAALMALSPFMIYYSVEARAYALMIFLLLLSTLALLAATESGRAGWWVLYAACASGAMLSHYTAVFCLLTQFLWALWARPWARRGLLIATAGAVAGFLPWLSGFIADNNSPTTAILDALQPFTYDAVRFSIEAWAVGYPYVRLSSVPGDAAVALELAGLAIAVLGAFLALRRHRRRHGLGRRRGRLRPELVLVVALALATPLGEIVASAISTNLISARNLNASLPALMVCAGALLTAAGPLAGTLSAALLLAGFSIGAARTLESRYARPDYSGVAALIEREARPGDVVVDGAALTPVPTTPL